MEATFVTTLGSFKVKLFPEHAPKTIENFVGLAKGTKSWKSSRSDGEGSLYEGTIFHRVIPDFMIQGGDPEGTGMGGPGYTFEDELPQGAPTFAKEGILAMANAGPNTNGSQFFVTVAPTPWLNNRHTVFGEVVEGMSIVRAISEAERDGRDKPVQEVKLQRVEIKDD